MPNLCPWHWVIVTLSVPLSNNLSCHSGCCLQPGNQSFLHRPLYFDTETRTKTDIGKSIFRHTLVRGRSSVLVRIFFVLHFLGFVDLIGLFFRRWHIV